MSEIHCDSEPAINSSSPQNACSVVRLHLCFGWWLLLVSLTLGIALEVMLGLKSLWYVDVSNETRRDMLSLAHTHGTLLALVNIAFSWTVTRLPEWNAGNLKIASRCLLIASVLMPLGFFLGGFFPSDGDPSLGILLLPAGAVFLLVAILLTAIAVRCCKKV